MKSEHFINEDRLFISVQLFPSDTPIFKAGLLVPAKFLIFLLKPRKGVIKFEMSS